MKKLVFAMAATALYGAGNAIFVTNFENPPYNASATGITLNGQDGWYTPGVSGSVDQLCVTYAGNTLMSTLPIVGGAQFVGSQSPSGFNNRGQHDHDFTTGDVWTQSFYHSGRPATATAVNNLGSTSLSNGILPFTSYQGFIALNEYDEDPVTGTRYRDGYIVFDAAGVQLAGDPGPALPQGRAPGPAWSGLATDHWYRQSTTFNQATGAILSCTITDMATGVTTTAVPPFGIDMVPWYMGGGLNNAGALPRAAGMRHFTGGTDNIDAWDNTKITPGMLLVANSFSIGPGIVLSGDVRHLYESEDQKLVARPGVVISSAQAPVDILVRFTAPTTTPSEVDIVVESSANQANIGQTIALRNNSAVDEVLDSHTLTLADATTTVAVTTNASRFVDPATRQITARIRCKAVGPILSYPWQARFDRVVITGTP